MSGDTPAAGVWRFDAIGTTWQIETPAALEPRVRLEVTAAIDAFDREWSRFRDDSGVSHLAREGGGIGAPRDAHDMLEAYAALDAATAGAVNPLVARSLEALGYDATYSFTARDPEPAPAGWRDLVTWDGGTLAVTEPLLLDVGALGKGRLVDIVAGILSRAAITTFVVDAGGDLVVRGAAQRIGLEHPFDTRRAIGVWEVTDAALCASATNRRAWGDGLHHVLDARTGAPVQTMAATWAVADTAMHADAIATALFFDGGPAIAHAWGVSWVRMFTDGSVEWSHGCRAELFTRTASVGR
ncbi:FAD:protein FMN transferase [Microbacterium sp. 2FI]|uniref:FAD:protein FMN transferase n=1 Tax=Microbacterium sp. 2FI TaxID=2502193 RepID=UPI0010F94695|nr:FAD:protein FMN transferase [Microbacterium sp. 2FI]